MIVKYLALLSVSIFLAPKHVDAHSWIACTDYAEKNAGTWSPQKCRGFPRKAHIKVPKNGIFGLDHGYDHRATNGEVCNFPYDSTSYTNDHPMAVYYPGQQVVLVHPMKNHGADGQCGSIWIPDTGSWLYALRSNGENSRDPSLQTFRNNLIFNFGRSPSGDDYAGDIARSSVYPKPGYANAPRFCENTDKAVSTYSFNVPRSLRPGRYTFVWLWAFNSKRDLYSTCFEVQVVRNKRQRDEQLRSAGFSDLTEPCGGVTSNPAIMGNSNPGCTRPRVNVDSYQVVPSNRVPITTEPSTITNTNPTTRATQLPTTTRGRQTQRPLEPEPFSRLNIPVSMMSSQFSGEIPLPEITPNVIRRYVSVDLGCVPDIASFWNCRVISDTSDSQLTNHFELLQSSSSELAIGVIFYHVSFSEPCDLSRHPPVARLIQEDHE